MSKQAEKTLIDPIVKPEGSADGDNLILHPQLFAEHIQVPCGRYRSSILENVWAGMTTRQIIAKFLRKVIGCC